MSESVDLDAIDQLLEAGQLDEAGARLRELSDASDEVAVLHIKLALYSNQLAPEPAMQKLIQIMRSAPDAPRAKKVYQQASARAYRERSSSAAHSHPPPPAAPVEDKD